MLALYEDVHWADPTMLELLGRVIERVQRLPVLAVITFRPEFAPSWAGHGHITALSLSRLARRQGGAMIEQVTGGRTLPAEVLEQILSRTDGVPLFVEELTKAVLETGLLAEREGRYELSGPLPPLAIPATLQDSLLARLDRLDSAKEVAQVAAVIGREFDHDLLAAAGGMPDDALGAALDQLVATELVFRRGAASSGATYAFKHALVRDAAYQSLLKSRRQELHARVAAALEAHFPEAAGGRPELLAYHLAEAGQAERAIVYLQRASRRALARSAEAEAVGHLQAALAQLDRVAEVGRRGALEFELQAALGTGTLDRARLRGAGDRSRLRAGGVARPAAAGRLPAVPGAVGPLQRPPHRGQSGGRPSDGAGVPAARETMRRHRPPPDGRAQLRRQRVGVRPSSPRRGGTSSGRWRSTILPSTAGSRWTMPTTSGWWRGTC